MACKYVLVCQNEDCKSRGSGELLEQLKEKLGASADVEVKPYMCFGGCGAGPNIVLYPQKVWYSGVNRLMSATLRVTRPVGRRWKG